MLLAKPLLPRGASVTTGGGIVQRRRVRPSCTSRAAMAGIATPAAPRLRTSPVTSRSRPPPGSGDTCATIVTDSAGAGAGSTLASARAVAGLRAGNSSTGSRREAGTSRGAHRPAAAVDSAAPSGTATSHFHQPRGRGGAAAVSGAGAGSASAGAAGAAGWAAARTDACTAATASSSSIGSAGTQRWPQAAHCSRDRRSTTATSMR